MTGTAQTSAVTKRVTAAATAETTVTAPRTCTERLEISAVDAISRIGPPKDFGAFLKEALKRLTGA